jgi:hypothetical protein
MKRISFIALIILTAVSIMLAVALYVPTSLPAHSDFSAIYNTDLALVHRVPIYDLEQMKELAVEYAGIPPEKFFLARFPYPPWYALSTFYLGWMPAKAAVTLWFELNLVMLFLSVWLLTDGWSGRLRLAALPLALFFFPVLGGLSVGQYDFPVLLGTAMLIYALRNEHVGLTVLGLVLLTFKPHVGALILLSVAGWLILLRSDFLRLLMRPLILAVGFLFLTGFLADPEWILSYPKMLLRYQNEGNVSACSECASLPVWLSRWFFDGSLTTAMWIAIGLLVICVVLLYHIRSSLDDHERLISAALLVTLLVSPYLYNYDFLLLLVPFSVLISGSHLPEKIVLILCYLVPTFALLIYGRDGNISLVLASLVVSVLFYLRANNPIIDFTGRAAYNNDK